MRNLYLLLIALSISTLCHGQVKIFGGVSYSNVGPKAQIGVKEYFEEGNFFIRTTAGYTYEHNFETLHYDGSVKSLEKRHHIDASSVILFKTNDFEYGGGFSYRYFAPIGTGSVGVKIAGMYDINETYNVELAFDRTVAGENFFSLGINVNIY